MSQFLVSGSVSSAPGASRLAKDSRLLVGYENDVRSSITYVTPYAIRSRHWSDSLVRTKSMTQIYVMFML